MTHEPLDALGPWSDPSVWHSIPTPDLLAELDMHFAFDISKVDLVLRSDLTQPMLDAIWPDVLCTTTDSLGRLWYVRLKRLD